ncbi:ion transporter [Magnetofaba australis]|nr:ion transporter [Magnetofaba australis]
MIRQRLLEWVENPRFQNAIIGVILLNAAVLGIQTDKTLSNQTMTLLDRIDSVCLAIFIFEMVIKIGAYGVRGFARSGWNIFDFLIIAIAVLPTQGGLSILRALRIFRAARLISVLPSMRRVVNGMLLALPGVASVAGLLLIVFYIGGVISVSLFGEAFPQWFGDLSSAMYTLFQVMTLESWSMGIVRPVMEVHPYSWIFFIPFIMATTFTVLNLFIGIIVDAMATTKEQEVEQQTGHKPEHISEMIFSLGPRLERIEARLAQMQAQQEQSSPTAAQSDKAPQ